MDYSVENVRFTLQSIAAKNIDKYLDSDSNAPNLVEVMGITRQNVATCSGNTDNDYPDLLKFSPSLSRVAQIKTVNKVPFPGEIVERIKSVKSLRMVGLFTEINRAWLVVDSDFYIWTYEEGADVAYYDGLNDEIISVGLIRPKSGVFQEFITHLLVLTTVVDIVVLGVTFTRGSNKVIEEIQLVPDPIYTIPTDGNKFMIIAGTDTGRLFLGSQDGSLFEIEYRAESSWFGKRYKKINHSTNILSFLVPTFVNTAINEQDPVDQISVDNSRHILYVLTKKGSITLYDLGEKGDSISKIVRLHQTTIVNQAVAIIRNLESSNFYPIVSISAVEASESALINLVAVSGTGVRFYFTTSNMHNPLANQRPVNLTLIHVRLPPGYAAISTSQPKSVHMANYKQSNSILVCNITEDNDTLWCISSDMFSFYPYFMEAYTKINLDGSALAMAEVMQENEILPRHCNYSTPLVVRQHYEAPRKFIILTLQGAHIFQKQRPVDVLRQLLIDSRGPENDAVKTFFMILKEDQACATSLILACLENIQNADVAEWATRAFFIYGGEPRITPFVNNQTQLGMQPDASTTFTPNLMSTPLPAHPTQFNQSANQLDQSLNASILRPFAFSARHHALYLYLGRILRPIWSNNCVEKVIIAKGKYYFESTLPPDNCTWLSSYLNVLRTFLKRNTHLTICNSVTDAQLQSSYNMTMHSLNTTRLNQTVQDVQLEERQSLEAFKYLLGHCCQVLGLWRILCEHQFHLIIEALPEHHQRFIETCTFKDLILNGQDVCMNLINILINSYLSDNAAVDSISTKLRDICPDLYKNEDAACSKVYEMLKVSKTVQNINEKEELLQSALHLVKSVAPNINLHEICQQFAMVNAYHAVTDICVTCAKKIDPEGVANYFYKNNPNTRNQDNFNFYSQRMNIYKELLVILDNLHGQMLTADTTVTLGLKMEHQENFDLINQIVKDALTFEDELLHVAVYEWMIAKQFKSEIIKLKQPTLEQYLIKMSQQPQNSTDSLDLLWKYYESSGDYASAAKILHNLASKSGNQLLLKARLGHLARAVICMRSEKVGYAPQSGVFLRDLEDKLEIAKVQDQVLESIINFKMNEPNAEEAVNALNSGLYDLTQLYEEFAENFKLWECKLAIIECAGYNDTALVENIWEHIITEELQISSGSGNDRLVQVVNKVVSLLSRYKSSGNCVPLGYIIPNLEMLSIKLKANAAIVPIKITEEIPIETAVNIYNDIISVSTLDRFWNLEENEFHLAKAFAELVNKFLSNESHYSSQLKIRIKAPCEDAVAKLLSTLYSKPSANELINILRNVQAQLAKF